MTGREKPKRKALHRGLDDIVNRDASLTSRLLGRVRPLPRELLDPSPSSESRSDDTRDAEAAPTSESTTRQSGQVHLPASIRSWSQEKSPLTHNAEAPQTEKPTKSQRSSDPGNVESRIKAPQHPARGGIDKAIQQNESIRDAPDSSEVISFKEFVARWDFILRSGGRTGKLRICEVLYNNTYDKGEDTFFTSYEKLAKLANLEKKQCAINIKQLENLGFVERLNIYNTATKQGTEFKLHLNQLPLGARGSPHYHYYDEELS